MVCFLGDGIAQALFSTFKLIAKLESSCRPNWKETIEGICLIESPLCVPVTVFLHL